MIAADPSVPVDTLIARQSGASGSPSDRSGRQQPIGLNEIARLAAVTAAFALILRAYAFTRFPSEWDVYLMAIGLWDGFHSGSGLGSPFHYGEWISFGYLWLVYALSSARTFASFDSLYALLNAIGFWSTVACLPATWWAVRNGFGSRVAWPATILFIASPGFLEIAGGTHPILLALALVMVGTALAWTSADGMAKAAMLALAFLAFGAALMVRLEVVLALPLVVLGPSHARSWPDYAKAAGIRLIPTVLACLLFFFVRSLLPRGPAVQATQFVEQWYSVDKIPQGLVGVTLVSGIATFALAGAATVSLALALRRQWRSSGAAQALVAPFAGPLVMGALVLVFWVMNPLPARHFILFAFAAALLTGLWLSKRIESAKALVGASVLLVAANQLLSAAVNPFLIEATGYSKHRGWPYLLTAPSGDSWSRRAMLKHKWGTAVEQGRRIAAGACGTHAVVSSLLSPPIAAALIETRSYRLRSGVLRSAKGQIVPYEWIERPGDEFVVLEHTSLTEPPFPIAIRNSRRFSAFRFVDVPDDMTPPANCDGESGGRR